MRARDIMSSPVITAGPDTPLKQIASILVEHDISGVPVVDAQGALEGIVTEGDLVPLQRVADPRRHLVVARAQDEAVPALARDVMTRGVKCVGPDQDVSEVARLMLAAGVKRIPVVEGAAVVGMISRRDILKVLARSDESIQAEVQSRLDAEADLIGSFRAQVVGGAVVLSGPPDASARRLATAIARCIAGVTAVRVRDVARV